MPSATTPGRTQATQPPADSRPSVANFERIVDDYQRRLYGFALRMTGNRGDAEEIVQDAFVRASARLGKCPLEQRSDLRLQPWLYTITLNVTRNRLRSKRPFECGARCARRSRRDPPRVARRAAAARGNRRAEYRDRTRRTGALAASDAPSCGGDPAIHRRPQPPRRLPRFSINRSARLNLTSIGPCAFCGASSVRKSGELSPKESPACVVVTLRRCGTSCAASAKPRSRRPSTATCVPAPPAKRCTRNPKAWRTASPAYRGPNRPAIWQSEFDSAHCHDQRKALYRSFFQPWRRRSAGSTSVLNRIESRTSVSILENRRRRWCNEPNAGSIGASCPARRRVGSYARSMVFQHLDGRRRARRHQRLDPFEQAALRAAARIPPGEVRSYAWVATQIGRPKAARAVGRVMARNPLPFLFPCHRVVDSSGDLHDYYYGREMKARLLEMEGYRGYTPTLAKVASSDLEPRPFPTFTGTRRANIVLTPRSGRSRIRRVCSFSGSITLAGVLRHAS